MRKSARFRVGRYRLATQPLSAPLQNGIRFLRTPLPAPPTAFLAVSLPRIRAAIRAYRVPHSLQGRVRFCLSTGGHSVRAFPVSAGRGRPRSHFGSGLSVSLARSGLTVCNSSSHVLTMSSSLEPHPHRHSQTCFLLTDSTRLSPGYIAPKASHGAVTSPACSGRLQATERLVSSLPFPAVKQQTMRPHVAPISTHRITKHKAMACRL